MKLKKMRCPNCGGMLNLQVDDSCSRVFCPYCGQVYQVDQQRKEIIITQNVNVTNRHIDDAEIIRAQTEAQQSKMRWLRPVLIAFAVLLVWIGITFGPEVTAKWQDKICAGWCLDYHNIKYQVAEQYLRELGFENIVLIDLNSTNESWEVDGEVESVTIDGNSNFTNYDYFFSTDKVIIRYY